MVHEQPMNHGSRVLCPKMRSASSNIKRSTHAKAGTRHGALHVPNAYLRACERAPKGTKTRVRLTRLSSKESLLHTSVGPNHEGEVVFRTTPTSTGVARDYGVPRTTDSLHKGRKNHVLPDQRKK